MDFESVANFFGGLYGEVSVKCRDTFQFFSRRKAFFDDVGVSTVFSKEGVSAFTDARTGKVRGSGRGLVILLLVLVIAAALSEGQGTRMVVAWLESTMERVRKFERNSKGWGGYNGGVGE